MAVQLRHLQRCIPQCAAYITQRGAQQAALGAGPANWHAHQVAALQWGLRSYSSSDSGPGSESYKAAEKMLDLISGSKQMQDMIMASLPPFARRPEMVQQMLNDPAAKQKLVEMIAKQKLRMPAGMIERLNSQMMDSTLERAKQMGIDPTSLFSKLVAHPGLLKRLGEPDIMRAFADVTENPNNISKYNSETVDVINKIRDVLGSAQMKPPVVPEPAGEQAIALGAPAAAPAAPSSAPPAAGQEQQASPAPPPPGTPPRPAAPPPPGTPPSVAQAAATPAPDLIGQSASKGIDLMTIMMSDPELVKRLQNPVVVKALQEIQQSPWKTVKYILNKDVMETFKILNDKLRGKA